MAPACPQMSPTGHGAVDAGLLVQTCFPWTDRRPCFVGPSVQLTVRGPERARCRGRTTASASALLPTSPREPLIPSPVGCQCPSQYPSIPGPEPHGVVGTEGGGRERRAATGRIPHGHSCGRQRHHRSGHLGGRPRVFCGCSLFWHHQYLNKNKTAFLKMENKCSVKAMITNAVERGGLRMKRPSSWEWFVDWRGHGGARSIGKLWKMGRRVLGRAV